MPHPTCKPWRREWVSLSFVNDEVSTAHSLKAQRVEKLLRVLRTAARWLIIQPPKGGAHEQLRDHLVLKTHGIRMA